MSAAIVLTNDFHDSAVTIRATLGQYLSKSQIQRARRTLCGNAGCTCGGNLGERGKQTVEIDVAGHDAIRLLAL